MRSRRENDYDSMWLLHVRSRVHPWYFDISSLYVTWGGGRNRGWTRGWRGSWSRLRSGSWSRSRSWGRSRVRSRSRSRGIWRKEGRHDIGVCFRRLHHMVDSDRRGISGIGGGLSGMRTPHNPDLRIHTPRLGSIPLFVKFRVDEEVSFRVCSPIIF